MANIWHDISPKRIGPENFISVIEISKGSKKKCDDIVFVNDREPDPTATPSPTPTPAPAEPQGGEGQV